MGADTVTLPPPPKGFQLEQGSMNPVFSLPEPPPGFKVEESTQTAPSIAASGFPMVGQTPQETGDRLLKLPRVDASQIPSYTGLSIEPKIAAGVANAALGFGEALADPWNLMAMLLGGSAPALSKPIAAGFVAPMTASVPEQARQAGKAFGEGDIQMGVEKALSTAGTIGMVGGIGGSLAHVSEMPEGFTLERQPNERTQNAKAVRSNTRQPVEEGRYGEARQSGGGTDLQQPTQEGTEAGGAAPRLRVLEALEEAQRTRGETGVVMPEGNEKQDGLQVQPKQTSESGSIVNPIPAIIDAAKEAHEKVKEIFSPENVQTFKNQARRYTVPATAARSEAVATKLIEFASSDKAAETLGESKATDVLGDKWDDPEFSRKLGGVIVEDIIRKVNPANSKIGTKNFPFKTEAEYQAALNDPEIKAAITRHMAPDSVQDITKQQHEALGGELAEGGEKTGAFLNLKAILNEDQGEGFGTKKGNLQNPLQKGPRFSRQRKGTAEEYEYDYRTLAKRAIKANYEEVRKKELYQAYEDAGLGKILPVGKKPPEGFVDKVEIKRKGTPLPPDEEGNIQARTYIQNLWLKKGLKDELIAAENTDSALQKGPVGSALGLITKAQVSLGADAAWHTASIVSAINGTARTEGIKQLIGPREFDTAVRVFKNLQRSLKNDSETQRLITEYSKTAPGKEEPKSGVFNLGAKALYHVDRMGRLALQDLYNEWVRTGRIVDSPIEKERFINQIGQYNERLMPKIEKIARESGLSPFIVAGKAINNLTIKRLALDPNLKAVSAKEAINLRINNLIGLTVSLAVIPAIVNMTTTGKMSGLGGVPVGAIDTGKDDSNGKPIYIDPAQWVGVRRGLRITGAGAVAKGLEKGKTAREIGSAAASDIIQGYMHPYMGPIVNSVSIMMHGQDVGGFKKVEGDTFDRAKKALKNVNPVVAAITDNEGSKDSAATRIAKTFSGAVGIKSGGLTPYQEQIEGLAQKKFGKELGQVTNINDRLALEKEYMSGKPQETTQRKTESAKYVVQKMADRQVALQKALPEAQQEWLDKHHLRLPSYQDDQKHHVMIPLTKNEEEFYRQQVVDAYKEQITKLQGQSDFDRQSQDVKQRRLNQFVTFAKRMAKADLEKAINNGTLVEKTKTKRGRFSIFE